MKNILFVCKHNVFRSKIAEAYFKKVNQNREINAKSAGIIKADIINWKDLIDAGSEHSAIEKGIMRTEGKNYIMQDGDVAHFKTGA